jgi:hypothetical protein
MRYSDVSKASVDDRARISSYCVISVSCHRILLPGQKNFMQDSQHPGREVNLGPQSHEVWAQSQLKIRTST